MKVWKDDIEVLEAVNLMVLHRLLRCTLRNSSMMNTYCELKPNSRSLEMELLLGFIYCLFEFVCK